MQSQGHCNIDAFQCGDDHSRWSDKNDLNACEVIGLSLLKPVFHLLKQLALITLGLRHIVGLLGDNLSGNVLLTSASMVMMQPAISNASSKAGMAVISLDLSSPSPDPRLTDVHRPKHLPHAEL